MTNGAHRAAYAKLSTVNFLTYETADFAASGSLSQSSQSKSKNQELQRRTAVQKVELHLNAVSDLERWLGLEERWTAVHPEYQKTVNYINNRKFICAVEKLEGLVVQRLFELSKANLSGTGERLL
jgi:hypothetical protein